MVLSWNMGLAAIYIATLLSVKMAIGCLTLVPNSFSRPSNHVNSTTVIAKLPYSISAKLLEITVCFFYFHDTNESPSLIMNPVTDLLVNRNDAQSTSQYICC